MFFSRAKIGKGRHRVRFKHVNMGVVRLVRRVLLNPLPLHLNALVRPVPIVRVANVGGLFSAYLGRGQCSRVHKARDARTRYFVLVFLSFFRPSNVFFLHPTVARGIFQRGVSGVQPLFAPLRCLFVGVVQVGVANRRVRFSKSPRWFTICSSFQRSNLLVTRDPVRRPIRVQLHLSVLQVAMVVRSCDGTVT